MCLFPGTPPYAKWDTEGLGRWRRDGRPLIDERQVIHKGRTHVIAQSNSSYVFPAVGLAVRAVGANRVTDEMFMAAAEALKDMSPALADPRRIAAAGVA